MTAVFSVDHVYGTQDITGDARAIPPAEKSADVRRELVAGQPHAIVGVSHIHNLIAVALAAKLYAVLRPPSRVYISDIKLRVDDDFYYPDLVVSDEPPAEESYYLAEPIVVIEILSPTTESRDRLEKRIAYQRLPSLREYVLVAQGEPSVEVYPYRFPSAQRQASIEMLVPAR